MVEFGWKKKKGTEIKKCFYSCGYVCLKYSTKNTLFPGDNETSNYEQFDTDEGDEGYMVKLFTNGLFLVSTLLILPAWSCMDFGIPLGCFFGLTYYFHCASFDVSVF